VLLVGVNTGRLKGRGFGNNGDYIKMKIYILQIVEHDDNGSIRDIDVTKSESKAWKWFLILV